MIEFVPEISIPLRYYPLCSSASYLPQIVIQYPTNPQFRLLQGGYIYRIGLEETEFCPSS